MAATKKAAAKATKKATPKAAKKAAAKAPKKTPESSTELQARRPFESLRREIDRVFEDFDRDFWRLPFHRSVFDVEPFWRRELSSVPTVDIAEDEKAYTIAAELPGMDEKSIDVKVSDGGLTIKGEKKEEREEKEKGYHLQERRFGTFQRFFRLPEGVDTGKVDAKFKNGVLTVTLPKKPEAQRAEKTVAVKPV